MKISDTVLNSYVATMLWSATDDDFDSLDASGLDSDDLSPDFLAETLTDLKEFFTMAKVYLDEEKATPRQVAHDFWLTRCGHGAGFWDGDYVQGIELTAMAKSFGNVDVYIDDNCKICNS